VDKYVVIQSTGLFATETNYQIHAVRASTMGNAPRFGYEDTLYFKGMYRYGFAATSKVLPVTKPLAEIYQNYITLYDGNPEGIVWNYSIKERDASPLSASCLRYFSLLKSQRGEKFLRTKYQIPETIALDTVPIVLEGRMRHAIHYSEQQALASWMTGPNFYVNHLPSWGSLPPVICPFPLDFRLNTNSIHKVTTRPISGAVVLGKKCEGIEINEGQGVRRFWIDPKTRFILRSEGVDPTFLMGSGNYKWHYECFDTIPKADAALFSLPAGTTVYLPELMWDYPLPKNLKRARKQGRFKVLGFPLHPKS